LVGRAHDSRPTVVAALDDDIDLVERPNARVVPLDRRAMVGDEQGAVARTERDAERIAEPIRPDRIPGPGIVGGHLAFRREPEHAATEIVQTLGTLALACIARAHVEHAVGTET